MFFSLLFQHNIFLRNFFLPESKHIKCWKIKVPNSLPWMLLILVYASVLRINGCIEWISINHIFFCLSPQNTRFVRKFAQHFSWIFGLFVQYILPKTPWNRRQKLCYLWLWLLCKHYPSVKLNWIDTHHTRDSPMRPHPILLFNKDRFFLYVLVHGSKIIFERNDSWLLLLFC